MELFDCKGYRIVHTPTDSDITNVRVVVNAGSRNEDDDSHGTAHFLEHMFYKGTEKRDFREINRITSRLGEANAYTGRGQTCYHFTFLQQDLAEALDVLLDMVFNASFPEEEFSKEKGVITEECQMYLDDPIRYFFQVLNEKTLGTPFGHPIIGTLANISDTTLEKLRRFRGRHYNPANMLIACAGNVKKERLEEELNKLLPEVETNSNAYPSPALNFDDHTFTHASKQAIIALVAEGITTKSEIDEDYMPDIFAKGLGGISHSLLFERLREELGLCYYVGASHTSSEDYGHLVIYVLLDESNIETAIAECWKIVEKVREEGFTDDLRSICKRNYLFKLGRQMETSCGLNAMADSFFSLDGYPFDDYMSFDERRKKVEAVTNNHIKEFANRVLGQGKAVKTITMTQEENK